MAGLYDFDMADTPAPAPAPAQPDLSVEDLHLTFLQTILEWLGNPSQFVTQNMLDVGLGLFWAISFLYFSHLFLKLVIESSSMMDYMGQIINGVITWGILKFVLDFYIAPLPGADGLSLLDVVRTGFDQVCAAMLGIRPDEIGFTVYAGFEAYMKIALMMWESFPTGGFSDLASIVQLVASLAQFKVLIADFAIMFITMIALVACAGLYIAIYAYAMMMFAVGMMVGPIMLPWKLLSPFSYIADGWMKFMVMAGMYKIVALAIIHINELIAMGVLNTMLAKQTVTANFFSGAIRPNFNNAVVVWANIESSPLQHLLLSLAMLLLSLLTIYMLLKVNEITSSLLSGAGGGGMSFGRTGMGTLGGSTGGGGGSKGGGGAVGQLAGMATGGATTAMAAAKSAAGSSLSGRTAQAATSAAAKGADKAMSALPSGAQMAAGAVSSAAKSATDRARQTMSAAGNSVAQKAMQSPPGQFAQQAVSAISRGGESSAKPTQTAITKGQGNG